MEHPVFLKCRLTYGGDWEWLARVLGLSGPNGKHFCNHCLVTLSDVSRGTPHSLHVFEKYQTQNSHIEAASDESDPEEPDTADNRESMNVERVPNQDTLLRSIGRCHARNAQYNAAQARKKGTKSNQFENCEHAPLLKGNSDKIIDTVSTTPLHISLGLGTKELNLIENKCIALDKGIKTNMGQYDAFDAYYSQQKDILDKYKELEDKVIKIQSKVRQAQENIVNIKEDRSEFFEMTRGGSYKKKSDLAKSVRDQVKKLEREIEDLHKEEDKITKEQSKKEAQLNKVNDELDKVKGPFKQRFDEVLDNMHLQRVAYHSGAIVGPDVYKITRTKNITKLANIFQPLELRGLNGMLVTYSSHELINKFSTLLYKFRACYTLYSANRELCRHEVELLALRCASFGCWVPMNFPDESLSRKFHLLVVDVPRQARRLQTVGMITEQTIESIHPYINKLERLFCTTQNKQEKGLLIMKQHNLFSQPCLPRLK